MVAFWLGKGRYDMEDLSTLHHNHKAHLPTDSGRVEPVAHSRGLNSVPSTHPFFFTFNPKYLHFFMDLSRCYVASTLVGTDQNVRHLLGPFLLLYMLCHLEWFLCPLGEPCKAADKQFPGLVNCNEPHTYSVTNSYKFPILKSETLNFHMH